MMRPFRYVLAGAVFGMVLALAIGSVAAATGSALPVKGSVQPMTDTQKQALVDRNKANNQAFLAGFRRNRVDPAGLRKGEIATAGVGPQTLAETQGVPLVAYGRVLRVEFLADPNNPGMLPLTRSTVLVGRVLVARGVPAPTGEITVMQYGGPVWQQGADVDHGTGGVLAELETDPLLLPGQEVVLFLQHPRTITGLWTPDVWMSAVGPRLDVQNGVVSHTHAGFAREVIGLRLDELAAKLQAGA